MIVSTIIVPWEVVHALGTGLRLQEQEGFCYGVMWQVAGLPDGDNGFIDWFGDSAEELREAFFEGVAAGCSKASEVEVHHQLNGMDLDDAQAKILNELWLNVRETDKAATTGY